MSEDLLILVASAASIGFFHTLLGPDHYLPFIVMSRSGRWSLGKTATITLLCGSGHVFSSVILGFVGIGFGIAVAELEFLESFRGDLAAWALIAFGLVYFIWGMRRALKNKPHRHIHFHGDGIRHAHTHRHNDDHAHVHDQTAGKSVTPWVLFTIFVLGPCEPLIPVLMYPAASGDFAGLVIVTAVFATITIATMLGVVLISTFAVNYVPSAGMERYMHAIAGATILLCGVSIVFLGL